MPTNQRWIEPRADDGTTDTVGGIILPFKASVQLLVGDIVHQSNSADYEVTKTTTTAEHLRRVGVVVGGTRTYGEILQEDSNIGSTVAAEAGEEVLVCVLGKAKVKCDGGIARGGKFAPSTTTAGLARVASVTTEAVAGDTGKIVGQMVEEATAGSQIRLAFVNPH